MKALLLAILFFSSLSHAVEAFRGPLSSALGGTGIAGLEGIEGVLLNPAQIGLLKGYEADAYYRDGELSPGQHRQGLAVGVGDHGPDVACPGALHYARLRDMGRGPQASDGELVHAAIADMLRPGLFVGLSGYQLIYRTVDHPRNTQYNYSLGSLWMVTEAFGVAYVLNNLAHPGSNVPMGEREDMQQGLGFYGLAGDIANLRLDITRNEAFNPKKKMVYQGSFESQSGQFFIFRSGYRVDDERFQRFLTFGFGFNGPRIKVDYAFEKDLKGASGALHSVDLRLPF